MKLKYLHNLISSLLIFIFIISPFLASTPKALAQATTYSVSGNQKNGISGYLGGVSQIATQLPLCKNKLGGAVKSLFKKAKVAALNTEAGNSDPESETKLSTLNQDRGTIAESIATTDAIAQARLDAIEAQQNEQLQIDKEEAENNQCLKSIGQLLIKEMLQKLTISTVNWINNGNEGGPFFVQNEHGYFESLIRQEILIFNSEINDPALYPFGKNFIKGKVRTYQNKFSKNAEYSLDKLIEQTSPEFTAEEFKSDFSSGGWGAWTALTQNSANNPLGFYILAGNELQERLDESNSEAKRKLDQSSGFLGDERCADPKGVTRESEKEALKNIERDAQGNIKGKCKRWEYVTPGSIIADWATQKANHQENALLKADDLNAAIAAILDAGINKFTNSIQVDGFFSLSDEGIDGSYEIDQDNLLPGDDEIQTNQDFSKFQIGEWLQNNRDFNLRTDLTQALIDEQRTYKEKLEERIVVLEDLNKTIYQLDYCIPGPHPGWEADSREALSAAENAIPSKSAVDFEDLDEEQLRGYVKTAGYLVGAAAGAAIGSVVPGFGTVIGAAIGFIIGLLVDLFGGDSPEELVHKYYSGILISLTGIKEFAQENTLRNKSDITNPFDAILYRYTEMIHDYYPPEYLPPIYKEAYKEFRKTLGYREIIKTDEDNVVIFDGIIKRLSHIKDDIDTLNERLLENKISSAEYEAKLKPYFNEFSSVSKNMITGDEIAEVDNITKQAKEEVKYVYEELLTGQYGCEKYLENDNSQHPYFKAHPELTDKSWHIKSSRRKSYPFYLWYDYNLLGPNEKIPTLPIDIMDKYNIVKIPDNKMPSLLQDNGPGFLSSVYYSHSKGSSCHNRNLLDYELDCLFINDLFVAVDAIQVSVGKIITREYWPDKMPDPESEEGKYYYGFDGACDANCEKRHGNDHPNPSFEDLIAVY